MINHNYKYKFDLSYRSLFSLLSFFHFFSSLILSFIRFSYDASLSPFKSLLHFFCFSFHLFCVFVLICFFFVFFSVAWNPLAEVGKRISSFRNRSNYFSALYQWNILYLLHYLHRGAFFFTKEIKSAKHFNIIKNTQAADAASTSLHICLQTD